MSRNCRKCVICNKQEQKDKASGKRLFFTTFPLEESRCKKWITSVGNPELVFLPIEKLHKNRFVCGDHFDKKNFNRKKTRLKKTAIPTLKLTAPPLTEEQLIEFPYHVYDWNKGQKSAEVATTSYTSQPSTSLTPQPSFVRVADNELITAEVASISHTLQPSIIPSHKNDITSEKQVTDCSTTQGMKRKLDKDIEMTPRKKKLVKQLRNTRCTLKSMRKSANIIDNIESKVLKDIVISACKNQKRKATGRRWTTQNKISCLAIFKRSAKTYRYLRHIIPLPSIKTLQNILKKIPMEPGINKAVLQHLKLVGKEKDAKEKVCALLFDEIALKPRLIYNPATDQIDGFQDLGDTKEEGRSNEIANHAFVFMLQGIYKKFKQPIAFYFVKGTISSEKLAAIIKEIIIEVAATGYRVLTTVCDQGPTNMGAIKLLKKFSSIPESTNICDHSFFCNNQEIYIIYDIPHLFKSIRNNFLKNGNLTFNGKTAKWSHLVQVEEKNRNFLYFSKITPTHVAPKYRAKMRVKYAAQILSNTVAAVLKLLSIGEKNESHAAELMETALVVQELDHLFDCTNGPSCAEDIKKGLRQNVSQKTNHLDIWAQYEKKLHTLKFINSSGNVAANVKCIHGYITSLRSLRGIWTEIKKLGFKYFNLRQVNQDSIENLFGIIRQHSPTNANPTCAHFMAALKTAVVTGLTSPHSRGFNCQIDKNNLLTNFHNLVFSSDMTEKDDLEEKEPASSSSVHDDSDVPVLSLPEEDTIEFEDDLAKLSEQPAVYISGYLASKVLKNHKCEKCLEALTEVDPEKLSDATYKYTSLREWWETKKSLTYPSKKLCILIQTATNIIESEVCPVLYRHNICQLAVTILTAQCDNAWFDCLLHKTHIFQIIYTSLGQLLIRRQCQRLNQRMAIQEENLADAVKTAQQQGKAK